MWPFGKKKEKKPDPEQEQVQAFADDFEAEEFDLVAVTGPEGFDSNRSEGDVLYTVTLPLTAWMDEDDGVVYEEPAVLTALANERLVGYLRARMFGNGIIKVRVRPAKAGGKFQLVGMPEPGMGPELKAILTKQVAPVTFAVEGFATFTLHRAAGWFQTEIDWEDDEVLLTFDAQQDKERCAQVAQTAARRLTQQDKAARAFAAEHLLEQVREQAENADVSAEEFADGLGLDNVQVDENGAMTLWYTSDLLWSGSVCVSFADGVAVAATIEE